MVDLHAHILPGMDDGAADEDAALEMCRMAVRNGTREIVAAPKTTMAYPFDPAEIDAKIRALQDQMGERLFIHRGADLRLTWSNLPAAFDERSFAFRSGLQSWTAAPTEIADDLTVVKLGLRQRVLPRRAGFDRVPRRQAPGRIHPAAPAGTLRPANGRLPG